VTVQDQNLWNLVRAVQDAELQHFGVRYSSGRDELKAKKLLCRKVFRLSRQLPPIPDEERRVLARSCLQDGAHAGRRELTALAQAKLAYVLEVLDICARFRCKVFASIVGKDAPAPGSTDRLRKDYACLFERFYYFLEDTDLAAAGIVVFDELDKTQSHLLLGQMDSYFKRTQKGRQRAGQIIPEPFFVHSDLTTGVQLADLVAYVVSWGLRLAPMTEPRREELGDLAARLCGMRHLAIREVADNRKFEIWSFAFIADLRDGDREPA
jgi:hypothetical protein